MVDESEKSRIDRILSQWWQESQTVLSSAAQNARRTAAKAAAAPFETERGRGHLQGTYSGPPFMIIDSLPQEDTLRLPGRSQSAEEYNYRASR